MRIQDLPDHAQLVRLNNGGRRRWDDHAYLLSDIAGILAGRPHPARPKPFKPAAQQDNSRRAGLRQRRIKAKREREARLTRDGGADHG